MQFFIEQIAIAPRDPAAAKELLTAMGAADWVQDQVKADGFVYGNPGSNIANLHFNYDLIQGKEFEVLDYTNGSNWVREGGYTNSVCHLGMHCTAEQLVRWREFFRERQIGVAQEVFTQEHNNPAIAGKRWYNYVIFDTRFILGVDIKFIVRRESPGSHYPKDGE